MANLFGTADNNVLVGTLDNDRSDLDVLKQAIAVAQELLTTYAFGDRTIPKKLSLRVGTPSQEREGMRTSTITLN